jgi:hypothetical protein
LRPQVEGRCRSANNTFSDFSEAARRLFGKAWLYTPGVSVIMVVELVSPRGAVFAATGRLRSD